MGTVDKKIAHARDLIARGIGERAIVRETGLTRHQVRKLFNRVGTVSGAANQAVVTTTIAVEIEPQTADEFAERITACWRKSVEGVIEAGRWLARAKAQLDHGEFGRMRLPFGERTAQRLMAIAADQRLTNPTHVSVLPNAWGTLYELTKLDDETFCARVTDGTIRPDMERRDIAMVIKTERRAARESHLGEMQAEANLRLPAKRYGIILADPEWRFEPWSRETGMDRSADNHYPTSVTDVIAGRPVADIAARDCILFLWATAPMLPHALTVMAAWGFEYKTHRIWQKPSIGTGYWFRNCHELFLVGTRGDIPAPAMGTQWPSVGMDESRGHSVKPDWQYELIESYFPHLPKIELNARHTRDGWDRWGLDAPSAEAAE